MRGNAAYGKKSFVIRKSATCVILTLLVVMGVVFYGWTWYFGTGRTNSCKRVSRRGSSQLDAYTIFLYTDKGELHTDAAYRLLCRQAEGSSNIENTFYKNSDVTGEYADIIIPEDTWADDDLHVYVLRIYHMQMLLETPMSTVFIKKCMRRRLPV